jgi:hypothetical protein
VPEEDVSEQLDACGGWNVWQSEQARMLCATVDHPTKIRVDGDQDTLFSRCHLKDGLVAWIGAEPGHFDYVVALPSKPFGQTMAGTAINEKSHLAS